MSNDIREQISELVKDRTENAQMAKEYNDVSKSAALVTCALAAGAIATGMYEPNLLSATFTVSGLTYGAFSLYAHFKSYILNRKDKTIGEEITNLAKELEQNEDDKEM